MKNILRSTTSLAIHFVSLYIHPGDVAVDATCGNGNDSIELARLNPGKLYCFDIQKQAIEKTKLVLQGENLYSGNTQLVCDSHANMTSWIEEEAVKAFIFNLGYLPSAAKTIITKKDTTIEALKSALGLLQTDGIICLTLYSGHAGGEEEKKAVLDYASALDDRKYHVVYLNMLNQPNMPPEIVMITRK